jgi:hypothetical protein
VVCWLIFCWLIYLVKIFGKIYNLGAGMALALPVVGSA